MADTPTPEDPEFTGFTTIPDLPTGDRRDFVPLAKPIEPYELREGVMVDHGLAAFSTPGGIAWVKKGNVVAVESADPEDDEAAWIHLSGGAAISVFADVPAVLVAIGWAPA